MERPSTIKKRAMLQAIRRERGCLYCGTHDGILDFAHRPGTIKLFNPTHGSRFATERLLTELAKCDVLCRPCHLRQDRTLPETERVARIKSRWQRWYAVNRDHRLSYLKALREHGIWHKEQS